MKRALAARALSGSGCLSALRRLAPWSGVLCLNYHRIGDGRHSQFDRGLWSASVDDFDAQVSFLKTNFDVVTPDDLAGVLRARRGRSVLITFDDGYLDNYQAAFPILTRHGVAATFFVTTGFLDDRRLSWWDEIAWMVRTSRRSGLTGGRWLREPVVYDEPDRERAVQAVLETYKALPADSTGPFLDFVAEATGSGRCVGSEACGAWMDWDMVREMKAKGMVIGGHTVSHPVMARLAPESQGEEIAVCARRLAEELGEPMRHFSYPNGTRSSFDDHTRRCLQQAGVQYAFSYYGGHHRFGDWDDLDVRRIAVESEMDQDWFRAIVTLPAWFGRAA